MEKQVCVHKNVHLYVATDDLHAERCHVPGSQSITTVNGAVHLLVSLPEWRILNQTFRLFVRINDEKLKLLLDVDEANIRDHFSNVELNPPRPNGPCSVGYQPELTLS